MGDVVYSLNKEASKVSPNLCNSSPIYLAIDGCKIRPKRNTVIRRIQFETVNVVSLN